MGSVLRPSGEKSPPPPHQDVEAQPSFLRRMLRGPGAPRAATDRLTAGQAAYVFGMHGLGSLVISGGVNFGIACAMYLTPDPKNPISLFRLPNTLAGDAALTIIIQVLVTWLIEWAIVTSDLRAGKVAPLAWGLGPTTSTSTSTSSSASSSSSGSRLGSRARIRWALGLPHPTSGPHDDDTSRERSPGHSPARGAHSHDTKRPPHPAPKPKTPALPLSKHPARILALLVPSFVLLWPPSLPILMALGTKTATGADYVYASKWAPEIFKLVLGGVLGLLVTPVMALFWLVREGIGA
ncbi:uncharacterized protein DNG_07460 [Cephalotrichum gorgonifer]|uniref:Uncharacterized protein n=1 Tax=Cephalotrichum gorgonifer TaxID=2041049 RepID=A0AAE8N1T2_9PEZI|nr:uncharacterized protein DNG_07460 [Cephalotrichum gorgonifer]